MPNSYPAEVNRTVLYRTSTGDNRPAVITGVASDLTVTGASRTSGVTTLTVVNSLAAPRTIYVELDDDTFNGIFLISAANGTSITYSQPGVADASGATGIARDVDTADLRVGHHSETYTDKLRRHGDSPKNDRWRIP